MASVRIDRRTLKAGLPMEDPIDHKAVAERRGRSLGTLPGLLAGALLIGGAAIVIRSIMMAS
jgi:hypothetical protein